MKIENWLLVIQGSSTLLTPKFAKHILPTSLPSLHMNMAKQPTSTEILTAINDFATAVEQRFQKMEKNAKESEHRLKSYIDDKLADQTSDLFKRLDKTFQKEKQYGEKMLELFRKHQVGNPEEIAVLERLLAKIY